MSAPLPFARDRAAIDPGWRADRLAEARAVLADVAHHQDGQVPPVLQPVKLQKPQDLPKLAEPNDAEVGLVGEEEVRVDDDDLGIGLGTVLAHKWNL